MKSLQPILLVVQPHAPTQTPTKAGKLGKQPELLTIWKKAKDANIDDVLRRDHELLELAATLDCKL